MCREEGSRTRADTAAGARFTAADAVTPVRPGGYGPTDTPPLASAPSLRVELSLDEALHHPVDRSARANPHVAPLVSIRPRNHESKSRRIAQVIVWRLHAPVLPDVLVTLVIPSRPRPAVEALQPARRLNHDPVLTLHEPKLRRHTHGSRSRFAPAFARGRSAQATRAAFGPGRRARMRSLKGRSGPSKPLPARPLLASPTARGTRLDKPRSSRCGLPRLELTWLERARCTPSCAARKPLAAEAAR